MKKFKISTLAAIALSTMLVAVIFCGCETTINKKDTGLKYMGQTIEIMTIDSCEYIYIPNGNASWGSHKGNCKFCAERSKK